MKREILIKEWLKNKVRSLILRVQNLEVENLTPYRRAYNEFAIVCSQIDNLQIEVLLGREVDMRVYLEFVQKKNELSRQCISLLGCTANMRHSVN